MSPQVVIAFYAVAKIGAIVVPIFSGFAANAVAARLADAGAVAVITADAVPRKGRPVAMKSVVDAALADAPGSAHGGGVGAAANHAGDGSLAATTGGTSFVRDQADQLAAPELDPGDAADGDLHLRHHRQAQGRGARSRRIPGQDRRGMRLPDRRSRRRPVHVGVRHGLDHGAEGGGRQPARWARPWCSAKGRPTIPARSGCGSRSSATGSRVLGVSPTLIRALKTHGDAPVLAHDRSSLRILGVHRRGVESRAVPVAAQRRWRRPAADHQPVRRHRGRRLLPLADAGDAAQGVHAGGTVAGNGDGRGGRRRQPPARGRGGRAGMPAALAEHDPRGVGRSRAIPGGVLVAAARGLGARRLGVGRRGRLLVSARPLG